MAYADDVNLMGDNIRIIERNADVLLNACKDIGLAVNIGKTKYIKVERNRITMVNGHVTVGRLQFKYLGYLSTNQFCSRGNKTYH